MFFLAHTLSAGTIFLVVGSLVVATRISAYYKEDLARDLAKMLPFAMLGIFLTTPTFFKIDEVVNRVNEMPSFFGKIAVFMAVSMAIEAILRVTYISKKKFFKPRKEIELEEKIEEKIEEKMQEKVEEIHQKIEEKHEELEKKLEESK